MEDKNLSMHDSKNSSEYFSKSSEDFSKRKNHLFDIPLEMLVGIIKMLDDASMTSLYLSSQEFMSYVELPNDVRGCNICISCVKAQHIDLLKYWVVDIRVPIHDKEHFTTNLLCESVKIKGGPRAGYNAKEFTKKILSILWFQRWFLNTKALRITYPKVAKAAASLDDIDHYTAITKNMHDLSLNRMEILAHCIKNGYLNIAEFLHKRGDIDIGTAVNRFLPTAIDSGLESVKWVLKKLTNMDAQNIRKAWRCIFFGSIRKDCTEMLDLLLDGNLFPILGPEMKTAILEDFFPGHTKNKFILSFIRRNMFLSKDIDVILKIASHINNSDDSLVIIENIKQTMNLVDIHLASLEKNSLKIHSSICNLFPVEYNTNMTKKLLTIISSKDKDPRFFLNLITFQDGAINEAIKIIWTEQKSKTKKIYMVSALLSCGLMSSECATEYISTIFDKKDEEEEESDED